MTDVLCTIDIYEEEDDPWILFGKICKNLRYDGYYSNYSRSPWTRPTYGQNLLPHFYNKQVSQEQFKVILLFLTIFWYLKA